MSRALVRRRGEGDQALPARRAARRAHPAPPADDRDAAHRQGGGLPALPVAARPRPLRGPARDKRAQTAHADGPHAADGQGEAAHLRRQAAVPRAPGLHGRRTRCRRRDAPLRRGHRVRARGDEPGRPARRGRRRRGSPSASRSPSCSAGSRRRPRRSTSRCAVARSGSRRDSARTCSQAGHASTTADGRSRFGDVDDDLDLDELRRRGARRRSRRSSSTPRPRRAPSPSSRPRSPTLRASSELAERVLRQPAGPQVGRAARPAPNERDARRADGTPRKLIVFTEHRDTLNYLDRPPPHAARPARRGRRHPRRRIAASAAASRRSVHARPRRPGPRRHRRRRRRHQPPARPPDGQLRPAVEPEPHRAALRPHPPHRPDRGLPPVEPRRRRHPRGRGLPPPARQARGAARRLGGQVFDVLGTSLGEMSAHASCCSKRSATASSPTVRASDVRGDRRRRREGTRRAHGRRRARPRSSCPQTTSTRLRGEMEEARARRFQPHFIRDAFVEAFTRLGGRIERRETRALRDHPRSGARPRDDPRTDRAPLPPRDLRHRNDRHRGRRPCRTARARASAPRRSASHDGRTSSRTTLDRGTVLANAEARGAGAAGRRAQRGAGCHGHHDRAAIRVRAHRRGGGGHRSGTRAVPRLLAARESCRADRSWRGSPPRSRMPRHG